VSVGQAAGQNLPSFQSKQAADDETVGDSLMCKLAYSTNPKRSLAHVAGERKEGVNPSVKHDQENIRDVGGYEAQLHLEMDAESYAGLRWIQGALEAVSIGEVIRRAIQAFEFSRSTDSGHAPKASLSVIGPRARRLHVRVPLRTKERLDRIKEETGNTYSDVINQSLHVLAHFVREREAIIKGESNGTYKRRRSGARGSPGAGRGDSAGHDVRRQVGAALC
jgi:hypothetical protein